MMTELNENIIADSPSCDRAGFKSESRLQVLGAVDLGDIDQTKVPSIHAQILISEALSSEVNWCETRMALSAPG